MKRIEILREKGRVIFYFDFQGLEEDQDVIDFLYEIKSFVISHNIPALHLTNVTGVFFTPPIMKEVTTFAKDISKFVLKDAVLGVVGAKKILLNVYNIILGKKAKAFDNKEQALKWLLE